MGGAISQAGAGCRDWFFRRVPDHAALAGLPLDWIGEHYERTYGISVQGWGSWLGDEGKALGLTLAVRRAVLLLFNWIVRRWPRRYWLGHLGGHTADPGVLPLILSRCCSSLLQAGAARKRIMPPWWRRSRPWWRAPESTFRPDRMYLIKASEKYTGSTHLWPVWADQAIRDVGYDHGPMPDDEVLFVFGHESGHYVLHHIPKDLQAMPPGCSLCIGRARRLRRGW
jgi:STE24 endopeptidase